MRRRYRPERASDYTVMTLPRRQHAGRIPNKRVFQAPHVRPWRADEDAVLREHYVRGGTPACRALLPQRSRVAIHRRAARLGLTNGYRAASRVPAERAEAIHAVVDGRRAVTQAQLAEEWGVTDRMVRKQLQRARVALAKRGAVV